MCSLFLPIKLWTPGYCAAFSGLLLALEDPTQTELSLSSQSSFRIAMAIAHHLDSPSLRSQDEITNALCIPIVSPSRVQDCCTANLLDISTRALRGLCAPGRSSQVWRRLGNTMASVRVNRYQNNFRIGCHFLATSTLLSDSSSADLSIRKSRSLNSFLSL